MAEPTATSLANTAFGWGGEGGEDVGHEGVGAGTVGRECDGNG
jgi:hypothetical protein